MGLGVRCLSTLRQRAGLYATVLYMEWPFSVARRAPHWGAPSGVMNAGSRRVFRGVIDCAMGGWGRRYNKLCLYLQSISAPTVTNPAASAAAIK